MIPLSVYEETLRGLLAPIAPLLDDASVTEVVVNGPSRIYVERRGRLERVALQFEREGDVLAALRLLAQRAGRLLDESHPILETHLPDGSRVQAVVPPAVAHGPHLAIRRFSRELLTPERLVALGALSTDALATLRALLLARQNVVVAGGTGSGKTSILRALATLIPDDERLVVIEDTRELALQRDHVVELEARPPDARGRGAITIRQLFHASLRLRPDRLVIGEIRGGEALDLVQAMTSGHGGCLTTVHATYPADTLHRLETLALMGGVELPLAALRAQIASAVDIIVQTARGRDGSRRVTHVTEVAGVDPVAGYRLRELFVTRAPSADGSGAVSLVPTGVLPGCIDLLHAQGLHLPASVGRGGAAAALG